MDPSDLPASEPPVQPEPGLPSQDSDPQVDDLERSLQEAEELLNHVKTRLTQVRSAQQKQAQLEDRLSGLKTDPGTVSQSDLSAELESVKSQLAATWEELESQLITWRDKEELFWQFLRFSGIGFGLAVFLNFLARQ
jgi:DNA repair exonuclease SbcCD ATPase subunit